MIRKLASQIKRLLGFLSKCLPDNPSAPQQMEFRQKRLLAWILLLLILFVLVTFFIVMIFNPHHDPAYSQYLGLIIGLEIFLIFAYMANCRGYYYLSAALLVASAVAAPWTSLLFDRSILQGDIIPLTYVIFSIFLSGIFLPTYATIGLAVLQIIGLILAMLLIPADASLNWISLLIFVFLISGFSILANYIIQRDIRQISDQAHQLTLSEARLQELSIRDHLTHLFNRRYLEETLEREIKRAARAQNPVGVIMLDVDHFKNINDTLGHATGDDVLQKMGEFLAGQVRKSDVACRYGGDEFVLVLPNTSLETTRERAEQLRCEVKTFFRERGVPASGDVSISLGVAVFPDDGPAGEAVLKAADVALLSAKRAGSDRVIVAGRSKKRGE
jgi:diguanylate cyclase (GGDEF)-like protein